MGSIISKKLTGKVAIVTGASKGIGASIAQQLASQGAAVVVNYSSSKAGADKVVDEITKQGGKAIALQADVAKKADIERLFVETKKSFGQIDVLVNNAGVFEFSPLEQITPEQFHRQFNINVLGLILTTQEAVKYFGPNGGSVINISSVSSTSTLAGSSVYSATKASVDTVTKIFAKELGARKIRVNAVNPGMTETEGLHAAGFTGGDFQKQTEAETPLGRIGQPQDVAKVVAFLATDDSVWVNGESIRVAGGYRG